MSLHFGASNSPLTPLFVQLLELAACETRLRFFQQYHVSARHTFLCFPSPANAEVIQDAYGFGVAAHPVQRVVELRFRCLKQPRGGSEIYKFQLRKRPE